jgi:hypothetical protein
MAHHPLAKITFRKIRRSGLFMNNAYLTAKRSFRGSAVMVASLFFFDFTSSVHAATPDRPDAISPDGGRYYGPLPNGVRHGFGKIGYCAFGYCALHPVHPTLTVLRTDPGP